MKVIFLDRDGVINEYPGDTFYVTHWGKFKFIPGSIEGIRKFNEKGFKLFVVSNQAGVAKGLYSQKDLDKMTKKMRHTLEREKVTLSGVYYCTHREEDNCSCRKPKAGLLHKIVSDFSIVPEDSFFIGDSFRDMKAAKEFGAKPVLVLSGKEKISNRSKWEFEPDYIFDNLLVASHYLCTHYG
ncbi:MAG: D-glycero-beta-D-manno-heptose 1,7-bisphosphate 7-phosphatase [Candidatus Omnitrophica bacterium]|nr:D-glycero-beta-D-manno-heptose 1,7-bisphosphate 7-phosphatase [Candidatus Omnitrophota bacterium]MBU0897347.1 D-glycero-beta-D-manno-heptose 1,7-bisphosphate 7-phosphatase [Candidatus Omnitrophota bacterium]MBU1133279.1 D-glycero-beta-D-manno-heptose 1,7-bisphosphate 7-phosphatase [Candidatus Omnitrophota bacterium]MBU1366347.1 D-glycero-beta-D-manno-heptose 1,7-bisphosphate 7-phosphatase [Candidatus Omnitrophota bacterium]MBU1523743.1 D-glycero-beta-D-manno-heptose 1,7-bisphosphate 7-phosph